MSVIQRLFLDVHRTTDWSALSGFDVGYVAFNAVEAAVWFACAGFVLVRNRRAHRSPTECVYGLLFALFGVSDLIECFQLSSPLIWAKAAILVPLLILRRRVMRSYDPRPRLV